MGLHVHSLAEIPIEAQRSYYIYVLDYGWEEPLGASLLKNFDKMAAIASKSNAVVIKPTKDGVHLQDEVFSWHGVNGEEENILPAILITDRHPKDFKENYNWRQNRSDQNFRIVLLPLRKYCSNTTDVTRYINLIFRDIVSMKDLSNFSVYKEMKRGLGQAIVDGLLLEPNFNGIGFNFRSLIDYFKKTKI